MTRSHLTMEFEPSIADRFPTLREYIAHRVSIVPGKPAKTIAAEMDMAPSKLSRKLNPRDEDTARFTVDDLEAYIASTGDAAAVIEYIAAKYLDDDSARRARLLSKVESMLPELTAALSALKEAAPPNSPSNAVELRPRPFIRYPKQAG